MDTGTLRSFCIYSVIGTISILPLLVLPAMVGVLVDDAGLTEQCAGWSASANFLGGALIALLMAFRMHRLDMGKVATIALGVAVVGDIASAITPGQVSLFLIIRFITGLGTGAAYNAAVSSFARCANAERGYGIFITLQFIVSGLGLYILPVYSSTLGVSGMFLLIAALDVAALMLARSLPGKAIDAWIGGARTSETGILFSITTIFAVIGFCLFEAANTTQFTYAERLGVSRAFSPALVGMSLMVGSLVGIPGAFSIVVIGNRFGRIKPLALGVLIAIGGLSILIATRSFVPYLIGSCCLGFSWAFCLPYIQTLMATLDPNGSAVAAGSFSSILGGAAGPGLAAVIVGDGNYPAVFLMAAVLFLAAFTGFFVSDHAWLKNRMEA